MVHIAVDSNKVGEVTHRRCLQSAVPGSPVWRLQLTHCRWQNSSYLRSCPLKGKNSEKRHRAVFSSKTFTKQSESTLLRKQEGELSGNQKQSHNGGVCMQSVVSDSWRPHGLQPARLLCPWDSPGRSTGAGLPRPPPGGLPDPGTEPASLTSPAGTTRGPWEAAVNVATEIRGHPQSC